MEIVLYGHATETDDLSWKSDTLNVRKRIMSIVKRGGLLDVIIEDSMRSGDTEYFRLTERYLHFESRCQKLLENLTDEEKEQNLEGIDIEAEFATRFELLGIPIVERVRLSLFVIERIRKLEERKILLNELKQQEEPEIRLSQLIKYLKLVYPRFESITDRKMRNALVKEYEEIEENISQSLDKEYLSSQKKIIGEVDENLAVHTNLIAVLKDIIDLHQDTITSEFIRSGIDMIKGQREHIIPLILSIDNNLIMCPIHEEFDILGSELQDLERNLIQS